ncbi:MAG: 8-amino-7-oxononanoate synthase [Burkholderiales bacterium]
MLSDLEADLRAREAQGLLRHRRILESAQGAHVTVDGQAYLAFCSNDYLGFAAHPALIEAARQGAAQYGVGAGASHLILGHTAPHHQLETELAQFTGQDATLLFSTGYMANLGIVTALMGRNDLVLADKLNHASLNDAAQLSRARLARYNHLDIDHLQRLLATASERKKIVVTDAVFSMDGDIAPLPALLALCERFDAYLLVDDAHGFGVLGEHGRGILEHFNLRSPRLIYMATLGKAAGVFGAFAAGNRVLIQTLIQNARSYIYTTAFPPLLAVALHTSLQLFREESWRRQHLRELVADLKRQLHTQRWALSPSDTPIQPLLVGGNREVLALSDALRARGILVPAIRPPTVPKGEARLRISLSAAHSKDDVRRLAETLKELESKI